MNKILITFLLLFFSLSCSRSQSDEGTPLGSCEGCEAVFEYGDNVLLPVDTLPGFFEEGEKLVINGTIYKNDGKTPAEGVILYVYHTNQKGIYAPRENSTGWEKRHGYMRGWVKTDSDGKYSFYTIKPASYPNSTAPAHIHPVILEPDGRYYWIAEFLFDGDPHLGSGHITDNPRGGTDGILKLHKEGNLLKGERDIVLGRNVPGY